MAVERSKFSVTDSSQGDSSLLVESGFTSSDLFTFSNGDMLNSWTWANPKITFFVWVEFWLDLPLGRF